MTDNNTVNQKNIIDNIKTVLEEQIRLEEINYKIAVIQIRAKIMETIAKNLTKIYEEIKKGVLVYRIENDHKKYRVWEETDYDYKEYKKSSGVSFNDIVCKRYEESASLFDQFKEKYGTDLYIIDPTVYNPPYMYILI